MSEVAIQKFPCGGCGKRYPWKAELSKKRVKCKCGAVMTVPDLSAPPEDDGPPALPGDDIFDMVDQQREIAPPRYQSMEAAAVVAMPVAGVAKPRGSAKAAPLAYQSGPTRRQRERADSIHDMTRDVYVPLGLIAGSFLAYSVWLMIDGRGGASSIAVYGIVMVALFAVKTVCMIAGAFVVASLAGVSFGPIWTAILKLAAVCVAPDIFATIVEEMIHAPGAGLLAGSLALGFYWVLVAWLFSMDANEAWMVVVLFGVLRWFLTFVVGMIIIGMALSGGIGGGSGSNSAPMMTIPTATSDASEFDDKVSDLRDNNRVEEAAAYIQRTGRQSGMNDVVSKLYDAGAKNVWFGVSRDINGKAEPYDLIVEWPRDAKKRAAVLAVMKAFEAARHGKVDPKMNPKGDPDFMPLVVPTDEGGKYVEIHLGG